MRDETKQAPDAETEKCVNAADILSGGGNWPQGYTVFTLTAGDEEGDILFVQDELVGDKPWIGRVGDMETKPCRTAEECARELAMQVNVTH